MFTLKPTTFLGRNIKIICQNKNGPCPLLAICNSLVLQNKINFNNIDTIKEGNDEYVSLTIIIEQVATLNIEAANNKGSDEMNHQLSVILEKLPKLADGLDLNVRFTDASSFEFTEEISIFDGLDIPLLHGWCIDEQARDTRQAIEKMTYNQLMFKIIAYRTLLEKVDIMIRDLFTQDEESRKATEAEKAKIQERIELYKKTAEDKKKAKKKKNAKKATEIIEFNESNAEDTNEDNDYVHVSKEEADTTDNTPNTTSSDHAVDEINRVKQLVSKWEELVLDKKKSQKNFKISIVEDEELELPTRIDSDESFDQPQEEDDDDAFAPVEMHPHDYIIASKNIDQQSLDLIKRAKLQNQLSYDKRIIESLSDDENLLLYSGPIIESFLEETSSQLTYYGLVSLHESIKERQVAVFFRNNHFSTILKYRGYIYSLVTDLGYQAEPSVVWEFLNEINGNTDYYNDQFEKPQIIEPVVTPPLPPAPEVLPTSSSDGSNKINENTEELSEDYLMAKRLQEEENRMVNNSSNQPTQAQETDTRWLREQERLLSYYQNNRHPQQNASPEDIETARRNDEYNRQQYLRRIQREDPLLFANMQNSQQPVSTGTEKKDDSSCSIQ